MSENLKPLKNRWEVVLAVLVLVGSAATLIFTAVSAWIG